MPSGALPWVELMNRCDPESPVEEARFWANREHSPYDDIIRWLRAHEQSPKILVTGLMGSGKSTELLRVANERKQHDFVVHIDLSRAFSRVIQDNVALQYITAWEVCFLLALVAMARASDDLGLEWPKDISVDLMRAWQDAAKENPPDDLDVMALARQLVAGAGAVLAATGHPIASAIASTTSKAVEPFRLPMGRKNRADLSSQTNRCAR